MKVSTIATIALVGASTAVEAGFVKKAFKAIFRRDEVEELLLVARDASIAEWIGKIHHWNAGDKLGISATAQKTLTDAGCKPPKVKRDLGEITDAHIYLTARSDEKIKTAEAWEAAKNPKALPQPIKKAFKEAGWSGTCVDGLAARSLDLDDDLELYIRGFSDELDDGFYY